MSDLIVFEPRVHVVPVKTVDHRGIDLYKGNYNEIDPRMSDIKYRRPKKAEIRLRRGKLQNDMTTQEIRELELWRLHKKHVDYSELLLLGRYCPTLPEEGRIIAFRSLTVLGKLECVAAICRVQDERHLNLVSPNKAGKWRKGSQLLVEES